MDKKPILSSIKNINEQFPVKNVNILHRSKLSSMDKMALFVTEKIGTMGFFFFILSFNLIWILWNTFAPKEFVFDPAFSFLILLFLNNILQILFMPLIMVGQNVQGKHSELRSEHDFETDKKAEKEIEAILMNLENQQKLVSEILGRLEKIEKNSQAKSS